MDNDIDDHMLEQAESLESDEVRNRDGDEMVNPPDQWVPADDHESLDEKLATETSDAPRDERVSIDTPERIRIDGTPEDDSSFLDVRD